MHRLLNYALLAVILAGTLAAQDGKSTFTINANGILSGSSTGKGVVQGATNSGGFLASYRFDFQRFSGIEMNYGYTRNRQYYTIGNTMQSSVHELTGAYVLRLPFEKVKPFAMVGGGALVFNPTGSGNISSADTQTRPAFLYGAGLDYQLFSHFGVRAQYRGLVYKAPDFGVSYVSTGGRTHSAQPSIGFFFNF